MQIGIRAHDVCSATPDILFKKIRDLGFTNIQLVFKKALKDNEGNPILLNENSCIQVKKELDKNNLYVAMLGAYFNPVHSNKLLVKNNIDYFKDNLKYASLLNAKYVGTETGSYNDDKWTYNPRNQTEDGYQETIKVFRELKLAAEKYKTTLLIEPAYGHVIYSTEVLLRAINELKSDYVKVTIDLYNLLYVGNYQHYKQIFTKALETFKEDVKIIHLKDFKVVNGEIIQCGLGKGIIDFSFIINTVKKFAPDSTLIFEGVVNDDIPTSLNLIKELM